MEISGYTEIKIKIYTYKKLTMLCSSGIQRLWCTFNNSSNELEEAGRNIHDTSDLLENSNSMLCLQF